MVATTKMSEIADAIRNLYKSEKYADLTIRCDGTAFKVHCAIVCTRSPVLAAHVDGPFEEASTRIIDLPDDELPIIEAMIEYLYTGDYTLPSTDTFESGGINPPQVFNVKLYVVGDKYDIPGLKLLAAEKFRVITVAGWDIPSFCEAATLLWENTVDSDTHLRNIVVSTASQNVSALLKRKEFVELLTVHGDLSVAVLRAQLGHHWSDVKPETEIDQWYGRPSMTKKERKRKGIVSSKWGYEAGPDVPVEEDI